MAFWEGFEYQKENDVDPKHGVDWIQCEQVTGRMK